MFQHCIIHPTLAPMKHVHVFLEIIHRPRKNRSNFFFITRPEHTATGGVAQAAVAHRRNWYVANW